VGWRGVGSSRGRGHAAGTIWRGGKGADGATALVLSMGKQERAVRVCRYPVGELPAVGREVGTPHPTLGVVTDVADAAHGRRGVGRLEAPAGEVRWAAGAGT
jgi:hypothetical protein